MPIYNLLQYSDNYVDCSASLYQFKRNEYPIKNAGNPLNVASSNSSSFKYKASLLRKATDYHNNRSLKNAKIVVPLKYLSNFFRPLEMSLINCKLHLELSWSEDCVMYGADGDMLVVIMLIIEKQHLK